MIHKVEVTQDCIDIKFQVQAEHIEKGKVGDCHLCAVALAILDSHPEFKMVEVSVRDTDIVLEDGSVYTMHHGGRLQEFVRAFDNTRWGANYATGCGSSKFALTKKLEETPLIVSGLGVLDRRGSQAVAELEAEVSA